MISEFLLEFFIEMLTKIYLLYDRFIFLSNKIVPVKDGNTENGL